MERIDVKKLSQAIRELNDHRTGKLGPLPDPENWREFYAFEKLWGARRATILYSMAAECHGRLHVKKSWDPTYAADGGVKLVVKTREDQLKLIGDAWKEFRLEDAAAARTPELVPALPATVSLEDEEPGAPELPPVLAVLPA
jgi:hypothetical protein